MAKPAALRGVDDPFKLPERQASAQPIETIHDLQAAVEGVPVGDRIEFMGEEYRVADKIGLMPLLRFAHSARAGIEADDMEGLAAIYDMLHDCLNPGDWDRFERDATAKKAEAEELLAVVGRTIEVLTARPTRRPVDSSAGPSTISPSSTVSSPPSTPTGPVKETTLDELKQRTG